MNVRASLNRDSGPLGIHGWPLSFLWPSEDHMEKTYMHKGGNVLLVLNLFWGGGGEGLVALSFSHRGSYPKEG